MNIVQNKYLIDELLKYRYIVLGLMNAPQMQNYFTRKWDIQSPNKVFDIVDTKECKLIEVKTTTRVDKALNEYALHLSTSKHTCLITVDMTNLEMTMTKKMKCQETVMRTLNIEDTEIEESDLPNIVFSSPKIKMYNAAM